MHSFNLKLQNNKTTQKNTLSIMMHHELLDDVIALQSIILSEGNPLLETDMNIIKSSLENAIINLDHFCICFLFDITHQKGPTKSPPQQIHRSELDRKFRLVSVCFCLPRSHKGKELKQLRPKGHQTSPT